jgi:hypothetical protein
MRAKGPRFLAAVAAVVLWAAPSAHADTTLPSGFGDMVVDPVHSHVFVSTGSSGSSVSVLDFNGNLVDTITGLSYPAGMALDPATSTLYVALEGGSGIATVDTATLAVTGELSVAPWTGPKWLGLAGGRLWFSHDCVTSPDAGMASIALDGSDLQTPDGADLPYYCPMFAPSPTDPNVMAVVDIGVSPSIIYVYDVSTSTPSVLVSKSDPVGGGGQVEDLVISPDGTELLGFSPTAGGVPVFRLSDLARVRTYSSHGAANAAAISSDGAFVAAGRGSTIDDPDVIVYNAATLTEARRFTFAPTSNALYDGALAFSPDKSRLFAVYITNNSETFFRAIVSPTAVQKATSTSLALSASKVKYHSRVTVKAHVTGAKTGTVSIYAKEYGGTKSLVDYGPLNAYGNFSTTFKPAKKTTFTAEYEGTDTRAPSKSGGKTVAVYAVATVVMGGYYDISGKYKLYHRGTYPEAIGGLKPTHSGSELKFVVQRYYFGAWRKVASDTFPADGGTVWAQFVSTTRGTYRIHTVFGGDAENLADTSPWAYFKIT